MALDGETAYSKDDDVGVDRIVIWRFVDGKPGHEKQSAGLIQGIERIRPVEVHEIDVRLKAFYWRQIRRFLLREGPDLPPPDLLVGVGHRTHLPLLLARLVCGGRSVVLMKPTLPLLFFDLLLVPQHDRVRRRTNIVTTRGAICPTRVDDKEADTGLILLGGQSPHFEWSSRDIGDHVEAIIRESPEVAWQVCDSRRTPQDLQDSLPVAANLALRHWRSLPADFLENALAKAEYVWVSADSASMLYESLSAQARVGIIALEPKRRRNKHNRAIAELVASGHVSSSANGFRLDCSAGAGFIPESRRCAQVVLERLLHP